MILGKRLSNFISILFYMLKETKIYKMKYIYVLVILLNFIFSACSNLFIPEISPQLEQTLKEFHNPNSNVILIAAHRSMHTKSPENSLAAIKHSIENGVDIIEMDVRRTKDGKLVLLHDSKIDRTTNGSGKLEELTFDETQKFNLISENVNDETYRIPLFEDALNLAKGKIMIDIDIKGAPVKELLKFVNKTETKSQVIFFDSEFEVLDSLLNIDSTLIVMPRAHSMNEVNFIIEKYSPEVIHIDDSLFTQEVINKIKDNGARVWINALGKPDEQALKKDFTGYKSLIEGGANIIQTDLPVELKNYVNGSN